LNSYRRILVVGPSWVGDMVMAHSLFQVLARRGPDTHIDVLAPAWSQPLLERMPEVFDTIELPFGHGQLGLSARWRLGRSLRGRGYQQAILLPNTLKSALVPLAAGIPLRTGWVGELRYGLLNDIRHLDKQRLPMTVQRFVALGLPADRQIAPECPQPRLHVVPESQQQAMAELGLRRPARPVLALCPGAEYGPAKRWPAEYFGELAASRLAAGWAVWLFGSGKDREVCAQVAAGAGVGCLDLSGTTSLAQAVDLLSLADAVVSNDSGLMHVAAALDRPLVALYGSSDPGFTPPLNPRSRVLSLGLECSPCFRRECPLGHLRCLRGISVQQVSQAVEAVLA
jgi:heptosyltransferase-2